MDKYLPKDWITSSIEEICTHPQYGYTTKAVSKGNIKLLRTTDITSGKIDWSTVPYCKEDPQDPEKYLLREGDIVISRAGSVGVSYLIQKPENSIFASYLIRFNPLISRKFFKYFLESPFYWNSISEKKLGIAIPNVNATKIKSIKLNIPPLPEQRAIVSKVEQLFSDLDNGTDNFKKAQEQLKRYRQSVLKAACEGRLVPTEAELACDEGRDYEPADVLLARILKERREKWNGRGKYKEHAAPDTNRLPELPEGWRWTSINQISHYIVDCLHSTPKFVPVGMYCIDTNCIKQAKILFDKARFVSEETYNERVSRLVPQPDDILFAREGTIGTAVIVPRNTRLCLGQRMMMFRAANGVIPLYFMWALQSQVFENQWKIKVLGTTVPHVNIGDIKAMAMPLPPTLEQRRIVAEVETRLSLSDKMEATIAESLQKAESLRQSILKKSFEGKLLNEKELEKARNAPDWEPAEKLLERIRQEKQIKENNNKPTRRKTHG